MSLALVFVCFICSEAQSRRPVPAARSSVSVKVREVGSTAIVIDETLSVLRTRPSLFADPVQRMRRGRRVRILAAAEADGVKFFKVAAPPARSGWVQSDAVFGRFRSSDEDRLAGLVRATDGFDQIELAKVFLDLYPRSKHRPIVLLLVGDLLEDIASKLSRDAASRLRRREMAASGAPLHSYYLNFNMIDRYRKIGVTFLFNSTARTFHYDGRSWKEIVAKYPASAEATEARRRLESLRIKMEKKSAGV